MPAIAQTAILSITGSGSITLERDEDYERWLGSLVIGWVHFHVEAIAVTAPDGAEASDSGLQNNADCYCTLNGDDHPQSVEIDGKPHLLFIYPFAA